MNKRVQFSLLVLMFAVVLAVVGGCSSEVDTPLGAEFLEDGLIQSEFGPVFQDTITIASGDTSFTTNSTLTKNSTMTLGRKDGFETTMLLRIDFTPQGTDTLKEVERAFLRLKVTGSAQTDVLNARFYELLSPFSEDDSLTSVITATDPISGDTPVDVDRTMEFAESQYALPVDLVEDWIKGDADRNGIAIVLEDTTTTKQLVYGVRTDDENKPWLKVFFTDGDESTYSVSDDGTFVKDLTPRSNLIISDGVTRRTYIPIDLSTFDPAVLLHNARLVLSFIPGSWSGTGVTANVYAPTSSDIGDPGILSGTAVTSVAVQENEDGELPTISFPVRTIVSRFLADPAMNHGLVIRMSSEGSSIAQAEFYTGSAADTLRPRLTFTLSEAPEFP